MLQIIKLTKNGKPCEITGVIAGENVSVIAGENARRALESAWAEAGGEV